ncbi:hypothetical protein ACH42_06305 [Endozoicomonas sp. (ex Bugula neritina AB1)]|nr:hypothetical protein ACH42_06305 [Endozoicomonas sp. (ex Bugula neritina AB1)]
MSITCFVRDINSKLAEAAGELECLEEGQESQIPTVNENDSILCQLSSLYALACFIRDQLICDDLITRCFQMKGFDYETGGGFWGSGAFNATVNGTATTTPWNFSGTENKSLAYQAMIDAINALPGWSVTLIQDPPMSSNDLVGWQFDYSGPPGAAAVLEIVRQGGDTIKLDANTGDGSFTDSDDNEISNDRQPVAC